MSDGTWPLGVFASIDAGLGVKLEVAHELGVPTIQLHAPAASTRTPENAEAFLKKLAELNIRLTCVFCGFEGESYADIPTVKETVGLVPKGPRAARVQETKEISDFTKLLNVDCIGLHIGFVPHDGTVGIFRQNSSAGNAGRSHMSSQRHPITGTDRFRVRTGPHRRILGGIKLFKVGLVGKLG